MLKARENQLRDEVAEGKELQQKVDEVRRVRRREDGQVGVGGGGEEEEEKRRRRREGIYVSTGNSACMPKCSTQCFAFEMLQKFILKHLVCKYSVLACSHVHVYSLDLSGVHK